MAANVTPMSVIVLAVPSHVTMPLFGEPESMFSTNIVERNDRVAVSVTRTTSPFDVLAMNPTWTPVTVEEPSR